MMNDPIESNCTPAVRGRGKRGNFSVADEEGPQPFGIRVETDGGAQHVLLVAQCRVGDVVPLGAGRAQDRAHVPRRVVDGAQVHGQRVEQQGARGAGRRLPRDLEFARRDVEPEREANREGALVFPLHRLGSQVAGPGEGATRLHFLRALQGLERGNDRIEVELVCAPLRDTGGGERRVVAQHAVGLRAVGLRHAVRLDGEDHGDAEGQHQQCRDDAAAALRYAHVHGLKNPSRRSTRQRALLTA